MDISTLKNELRTRVVTVTFKKVSGEQRTMDCTLNPSLIPQDQTPKGKSSLSEETKLSVMRVFDVKANGWRSFKIENLVEAV